MSDAIEIHGMEQLQRNLAALAEKYPEALGAALYQEGEAIMAKSVEVCPVDTARMLNSRYVGRPEKDSSGVSLSLGYGTDYAVYVHEMPANVNWTKPGSGNKFLERPLDEARTGWVERLAKRTEANAKAGVGLEINGTEPETPSR